MSAFSKRVVVVRGAGHKGRRANRHSMGMGKGQKRKKVARRLEGGRPSRRALLTEHGEGDAPEHLGILSGHVR